MTTSELDTIWAFHMNDPGLIRLYARPFGVPDALSDVEGSSTIDLETLVEIDPEVILVKSMLARSDGWRAVKNELHNGPVAGETSAVKSD